MLTQTAVGGWHMVIGRALLTPAELNRRMAAALKAGKPANPLAGIVLDRVGSGRQDG